MTNASSDESEILPIVRVGDPVLRRMTDAVEPGVVATAAFQRLIGEMRETMRAAPGVGLAAPQIGLGVRLAVMEDPPEYWVGLDPETLAERERCELSFTVLVNPVVEAIAEAGTMTFYEGCLSVPGYVGAVERARSVRVAAIGQDGEPFTATYTGWPARIVQHEVDHLDGCIYLDRVETRSIVATENLIRWQGKSLSTIASELDFKLSPGQQSVD